MAAPIVGIWLGGHGRRMGGEAKGLLRAPGGERTILEHLRGLCDALGLACVAVGPTAAYDEVLAGWTTLPDVPAGIGPLGGLGALLAHADDRPCIALACDMPHVTSALLQRLVDAEDGPDVLAPRDADTQRWQPLYARYASPRVRTPLAEAIAAGERSFQALFRRLAVRELALDETERLALRDWDTPEDVDRG